nr:fimbria/pilus periplasmic chaperone [Acinetobacter boissieri]
MTSLMTTASQAEIILHGTRIIYPSNNKEVSLQITNDGTRPALVQAWLDEGDANSTPDQVMLPFIITPPVSRVEPNKGQTLRITALPSSHELNQNQESLYWLNVLDIPPRTSGSNTPENFLQLAIRSRIKFIYRPGTIKQDVNQAPEQLQWKKLGEQLVVKNPTPFYMTLTSAFNKTDPQKTDLIPKGLILAPFSEQSVQPFNTHIHDIEFTIINDYGGRTEHTTTLNP